MMSDEQSGPVPPAKNGVASDYIKILQAKDEGLPQPGKAVPAAAKGEGPPPEENKAGETKLAEDPEKQLAYAMKVGYGPSKWLLEQEAMDLAKRRELHADATNPRAPKLNHRFRAVDPHEDIYDWARDNELAGLCFSGGGIRSATFNLGILQGMAAKGWLLEFDYLSSVSGGGYIHSWLAAWLLRKSEQFRQKGMAQPQIAAWKHVMMRLCPLSAEPPVADPQRVWPRQIQWLRRYSNYLTPRKGAFSGDTWSAVATWLRNVLLNQALLLLMFLALLCLPHLFAPATHLVPFTPDNGVKASSVSTVKSSRVETTLSLQLSTTPVNSEKENDYGAHFTSYFVHDRLRDRLHDAWNLRPPFRSLASLAILFYLVGCACIGLLLQLEYRGARRGTDESALPPRRGTGPRAVARQREFGIVCAGVISPLLLFGIVLADIVRTHTAGPAWTLKVFSLLLILAYIETFCGGALGHTVGEKQDELKAADPNAAPPGWIYKIRTVLGLLLLGIPAAVAGTVLAVAIAALLQSELLVRMQHWLLLSDARSIQMTLGTLLFFWLAPLTMVIVAGMIGKLFPEWLGEWLARIRAYTLVVGVFWICLSGCALLLPGAVVRAWSSHWVKWTGLATWVGTTLTGVVSGKSGKTTGDQHTSSGALEYVAVAGPYFFMGGLALLLSWILDWAQNLGWGWPGSAALHWVNDHGYCWSPAELGWGMAFLLLAALASLLGWRLDINQFSMHSFYRNRLTRCYLGASNPNRKPSPITGFDEHDSRLCIDQLTPDRYPGPLPIFCCTLNLTAGEDLAWQERKAASFAFTPLYSGYAVSWTEWRKGLSFNGFVPTGKLYPGGPNVATAMAASGAAISPNWGYHTNPATAFLLTVFDARLGLWVPNPRRSPVAGGQNAKAAPPPSSPRFAPFWLINELLGTVNDTSKYVYVTDGGHFDNTGLYELVRRRCYRIVICDSEEDGKYVYEGIGAAIRKCRIDFGAEIDLDLSDLSPNSKSQLSPAHVVYGSIRYPETPAGTKGTVTYIKASLTDNSAPVPPVRGRVDLGHVPADVQNYKRQHQDFPHDSTAQQWFTESQFESYRRLGHAVIEGMTKPFREVEGPADPSTTNRY